MATTNDTVPYILTEEFARSAAAAWDAARQETLAHGVAVFYRDDKTGLEVMEQAAGRFFEIRYNPGAPRARIYDVIREWPPGAIEKCQSSK